MVALLIILSLDGDSSKAKTLLELPNRSLIFRTIMETKESGILTNTLIKTLGISSKYAVKELKYLTSPAVGVVQVGSRIGKSFVFKLYGPGYAPKSNRSDKSKKRTSRQNESEDISESSEGSSELFRFDTPLSQKRLRWIIEIVQEEKIIQETSIFQIIRNDMLDCIPF